MLVVILIAWWVMCLWVVSGTTFGILEFLIVFLCLALGIPAIIAGAVPAAKMFLHLLGA